MATRARRLQRPATGWWPRGSAGRRRALRHWARAVALPREVGTLIPPPRVPAGALAPPAAPPPRGVREGLANLGRIAPRECANTPVIPGRRQWVRAKRDPMATNPESRCDRAQHLWIPGSRLKEA